MRRILPSPRNPGAVIQDRLREGFLKEAFAQAGPRERLLDVGCAGKPFQPLYSRYARDSVGIDVSHTQHADARMDILADGQALPFEDEAFDAVLCTEVMEHVPEPQRLLAEIRRVLRPGGVAVMTTPFLVPEHEQPWDFFRYTRFGLRYLAERAGLEVVEVRPFAGMIGVCLSFFVQVQLKFWQIAAAAVRWPAVRGVYNPFVFLFAYLPQLLYLGALRTAARLPWLRRTLEKLSYTPKGYGMLLRRAVAQ